MWRYLGLLIISWSLRAQDPYWIVRQDLVKFGKKELYEKQIRAWNQAFLRYQSGESSLSLAYQNLDEPEFIYFSPLKNFGALDLLLQKQKEFQETSLARQLIPLRDSALNFYIQSIHAYLPECSHETAPFEAFPYARYYVYAIHPGDEKRFEEDLKQKVKQETELTWCTWKVMFDSDAPKYVIYLFAKEEKDLKKENSLIAPSLLGMVRRQSSGSLRLRTELGTGPSSIPSNR